MQRVALQTIWRKIKRGSKVKKYLLNYKIHICSQEVHIAIHKNKSNYVPQL
jgi:hypothetical protein